MPFKSSSQRAYAFATKQPWAQEFADATPKGIPLPPHVGDKPAKKPKPKLKKKKKKVPPDAQPQ